MENTILSLYELAQLFNRRDVSVNDQNVHRQPVTFLILPSPFCLVSVSLPSSQFSHNSFWLK